jgi:hypothetical protein
MSSATLWTDEETQLAHDWGQRAVAAQHAHYYLAAGLKKRNLALGIPVVIFTTVVGTSLFASMASTSSDPSTGSAIGLPGWARFAIGTISILAAVLAAIQTFLRFAERAERHAQAADWYASIRREIEELLALPAHKRGDPKKVLDGLRKELNKAGQIYPEIGEKTWHRVAHLYGVEQPTFAKEASESPMQARHA